MLIKSLGLFFHQKPLLTFTCRHLLGILVLCGPKRPILPPITCLIHLSSGRLQRHRCPLPFSNFLKLDMAPFLLKLISGG